MGSPKGNKRRGAGHASATSVPGSEPLRLPADQIPLSDVTRAALSRRLLTVNTSASGVDGVTERMTPLLLCGPLEKRTLTLTFVPPSSSHRAPASPNSSWRGPSSSWAVTGEHELSFLAGAHRFQAWRAPRARAERAARRPANRPATMTPTRTRAPVPAVASAMRCTTLLRNASGASLRACAITTAFGASRWYSVSQGGQAAPASKTTTDIKSSLFSSMISLDPPRSGRL